MTVSLLTFEELVAQAERKRSHARGEETTAGWDRLLEVARGLAGVTGVADAVVTGRTWSLRRIEVSGYQGVGADHPLVVELDPTPGITVLYGVNGSGKSSIADAVETALTGRPRPRRGAGSGGGAQLWQRQHVGRDAAETAVEVTLVDGPDQLRLECRLDKIGDVAQRRATLHVGSVATEVDLASTTWQSMLDGYRPVFGYATIEREVQVVKDLQLFLVSRVVSDFTRRF